MGNSHQQHSLTRNKNKQIFVLNLNSKLHEATKRYIYIYQNTVKLSFSANYHKYIPYDYLRKPI